MIALSRGDTMLHYLSHSILISAFLCLPGLAQDSLLSKPAEITVGNVVEMRLQILACALSSASIQPRDTGPIFAPVSIQMLGAHSCRFMIFGEPSKTLDEDRKRTLVAETMATIANEIGKVFSRQFPQLRFDARQDLTGEWFPGSDPIPAARWKSGTVSWLK
jgi:hypothetical protein